MTQSDKANPRPLECRFACVASLDVVGYSRMIGQNAAQAVELIRALRGDISSRVAHCGGRLAGSAGDGYLAEFDSVPAAVSFALDLQYTMRQLYNQGDSGSRLIMRIGLDCGEVIDDEGELHGECINVAVRLQEAAPSGGILGSARITQELDGSETVLSDPLGQLHLKNIPQPITVFALTRVGQPLALPSAPEGRPEILLAATGFGHGLPISVLPFRNVDEESGIAHVCAGIRDELVLHLSRSKLLPVIDSSSHGRIAEDDNDALEIGRQLKARYLLTGAVKSIESGYSIAVRLLETDTSYIVWSEKYIAEPGEVHHTLDDIVLRIAGTVGGQIERHESTRARSRPISRASVNDLLWRGRWHMTRLTRDDSAEAKRCFEAALRADPENPEALIQLSNLEWIATWVQRNSRSAIEEMRTLAYRAMQANDQDARAHLLVGCAHILLREVDEAVSYLETSIRLNPSQALSYAQLGSCHLLAGRTALALPQLELSLRLNPDDYYVFYVLGEMAAAHCILENWDQAIDCAKKSMSYRPFYWHARMTEINASVRADNRPEAVRAVRALYARWPKFSRKFIEWLPYKDEKRIDYFYEGILQARQWADESA
ncbi:MAG: tetratricopeptide repeat protein [Halioglobus sp.]|nr:tetratricopeptide repeat protein [Halioglobus sp.]